jgi:hypothetical protein
MNRSSVSPLASAVGLMLTGLALLAPVAAASSIAYLDGEEVWVSTLDGSRKERLSAGEQQWRAVAAADGGRILGVRNEAGKISQLSQTQLWDTGGQVISQGPLPSKAGWSSYVAPLSLDLTSDGTFAVYGYSGYTGVVPNATFSSGHYAILSDTKTNLTPIGQGGYRYPTTFGRRVIAESGNAVVSQNADSGNPFSTTWTPLLDLSATGLELGRTDVAATGTMLALELTDSGGTVERIALISTSGVDAPTAFPAAVDCFIPATGKARDATLSQDGSKIAWKDDDGLKIAGVPTTAADPCEFSSPPILISPTGSAPSIGGADLAQLRPPAPAPAAPPAPAPPTAARPVFVTVPAKGSAAAIAGAKGLALKVKVAGPGKISVTGSVAAKRLGLKGKKAFVIATGSARATKAGTVTVRLKLTKKARKYRKRLKGLTITLRLTQGAGTTTRSFKLR